MAVPEIANAPFGKANPSVASNGTDFFVVWRDRRSGQDTLFGTRVTAAGDVLDPLGIRIGDFIHDARVVWAGDAWVVVWSWPESQNGTEPRPRVMAARIERDGRLSKMTAVAYGHTHAGSFAAVNGNRLAILYLTSAGFLDVRAVVVDPSLNVLGDHALTTSRFGRDHLSVAPAGDGFFAVWNHYASSHPQLEGARLDALGQPLAPARLLGTGSYAQAEAGDDGTLLVLVRHFTSAGPIWATRQISGDLAHGTPPNHLPNGAKLEDPALVRVGNGYVVLAQNVATEEHELTATRLDAAGNHLLESPIPFTTLQVEGVEPTPAAATNGRDILLAWVETASSGQRAVVRARLFDATTLTPRSAPLALSRSARIQYAPAVAFSGTNHLAVWSDDESIRAGRIGLDGRPLDGPGLLLRGNVYYPTALTVFDGRSYVVVWGELETGMIAIRFIDPQTTLGREVRIETGWHSNLAVATNGTSTIVAWTDLENRLLAVRVGRDSQQLEVAPTPLLPEGHAADFPALSWNGSDFLLAWVEYEVVTIPVNPFIDFVPKRIRGTRLSASLLPLDPALPVLADSVEPELWPSLASLNGEWLVTWSHGYYETAVRARRIAADLTPAGDAAGVVLGRGFAPTATADGARFVVAFGQADRKIIVTHLTPELIAATTTFETGTPPGFEVRVAPGPRGTAAVVYSRVSLEQGGVRRAFLRFVSQSNKSRAVR